MAFLPQQVFSSIIDSTPLVSIDLLIQNSNDEILLGYRTNRPAKNHWFVPGGRIQKNEKMDAAFLRLTEGELGRAIARNQAEFLGVYEHLYDDSVFDDAISTHYVVLGYKLTLDIELTELPTEQHARYQWFTIEDMLSRDDVHKHSKWYVE